jgi:hypothetical protein
VRGIVAAELKKTPVPADDDSGERTIEQDGLEYAFVRDGGVCQPPPDAARLRRMREQFAAGATDHGMIGASVVAEKICSGTAVAC